jgi:hypothetical protein
MNLRRTWNYLIRAQQQRLRDFDSEHIGRPLIDRECEVNRPFDWKVSGPGAVKDLGDQSTFCNVTV